jgi:4-alpha-glucanotransferase
MTGGNGAYVRFPTDDLMGVLALEATRAGALVVGEDLGTVPAEVPPALVQRGILSSKVLDFERDRRGGFKSATAYEPLALATANTHDMPTLDAFAQGRDITLRREAGLIPADDQEIAARAERQRDMRALLRRLRGAGVLTADASAMSGARFRAAVHAFLCRTPSQLVGLSLDDLCGEVEPVNLPGVGPDRFSSWTRKMSRSLAEIAAARDVSAAMHCGARQR